MQTESKIVERLLLHAKGLHFLDDCLTCATINSDSDSLPTITELFEHLKLAKEEFQNVVERIKKQNEEVLLDGLLTEGRQALEMLMPFLVFQESSALSLEFEFGQLVDALFKTPHFGELFGSTEEAKATVFHLVHQQNETSSNQSGRQDIEQETPVENSFVVLLNRLKKEWASGWTTMSGRTGLPSELLESRNTGLRLKVLEGLQLCDRFATILLRVAKEIKVRFSALVAPDWTLVAPLVVELKALSQSLFQIGREVAAVKKDMSQKLEQMDVDVDKEGRALAGGRIHDLSLDDIKLSDVQKDLYFLLEYVWKNGRLECEFGDFGSVG